MCYAAAVQVAGHAYYMHNSTSEEVNSAGPPPTEHSHADLVLRYLGLWRGLVHVQGCSGECTRPVRYQGVALCKHPPWYIRHLAELFAETDSRDVLRIHPCAEFVMLFAIAGEGSGGRSTLDIQRFGCSHLLRLSLSGYLGGVHNVVTAVQDFQ